MSSITTLWSLKLSSLIVVLLGLTAPISLAQSLPPLDSSSSSTTSLSSTDGGSSSAQILAQTTLDSSLEQTRTPAPAQLQSVIDQQIEFANQQDLESLIELYAPQFSHADGLDRDQVAQALQQLWETHPDLTYTAQLESWEQQGSDWIAVIATRIEGRQQSERGPFNLDAVVEVENRYRPDPDNPEQLQLVEQAILRESSTLTSGTLPPPVTLKIPETVRAGSIYKLEAIVTEPLGNNVLLGAVIEEPINPLDYIQPISFPLEPLQAGGLFRQADAPDEPGSEWISLMLVSDDGIRVESRRILVTEDLLLLNN